jgi:hypothetical protein
MGSQGPVNRQLGPVVALPVPDKNRYVIDTKDMSEHMNSCDMSWTVRCVMDNQDTSWTAKICLDMQDQSWTAMLSRDIDDILRLVRANFHEIL